MSGILVVDDDSLLRSVLKMVLEFTGREAQEARNGIDVLESMHPDEMIITGIIMPGKDGLEVIQEFRREHPGVRIITMSGSGRMQTQNCLDMAEIIGADYILAKPFANGEALNGVHRALQT